MFNLLCFGVLMSASAVPHCGTWKGEQKTWIVNLNVLNQEWSLAVSSIRDFKPSFLNVPLYRWTIVIAGERTCEVACFSNFRWNLVRSFIEDSVLVFLFHRIWHIYVDIQTGSMYSKNNHTHTQKSLHTQSLQVQGKVGGGGSCQSYNDSPTPMLKWKLHIASAFSY